MVNKMPENEGISVKLFDKHKLLLGKEIGSGSFGKVYKGTIKGQQNPSVAVKIFHNELRKGEITQREKNTAYEELLKLAVLDHENIVKLHGVVQDELPWLIFELMKDGNLLEYVVRNDNIREKTLVRFCRDICCGMAFLHSHKVLHKDLAARNILLSDKTAKIADLGLSSFLSNEDGEIYALNGKIFPYRHAARECIVEQIYTYESDVWSFGVLMHEVFNQGMTPYGRDKKQPEVRNLIVQGVTPLHLTEPHCSLKIILIMKSILNPNMMERPNFQRLFKKFQKLLTGTMMGLELPSNENLHINKGNDSSFAAVSTFNKIKANGLSKSINNLQISGSAATNASTNLVVHPCNSSGRYLAQPEMKKNGAFLRVSDGFSTQRSTSTPDIVQAIGASANTIQLVANNFLSVSKSVTGGGGGGGVRRHSLAKINGEAPLSTKPKSLAGSPKQYEDFLAEPRGRANSSSKATNNPLLEGFVHNRFTKRN